MNDIDQSPDYEDGCALCGKEVLTEHDLCPHICGNCNLREGIAKLRAELEGLKSSVGVRDQITNAISALEGSDLKNVRLRDCYLEDCHIHGGAVHGSELNDCDVQDSKPDTATVVEFPLTRNAVALEPAALPVKP